MLSHPYIDLEQMELLDKKSHTSFGKLILSDEKNSPLFSKIFLYIGFTGAERFQKVGGIVASSKTTPGPIYNQTDQFKYGTVIYKSDSRTLNGDSAPVADLRYIHLKPTNTLIILMKRYDISIY